MTLPTQRLLFAAVVAATILSQLSISPAATPELKVISTFATGGGGRWDYPTVDCSNRDDCT